MSNEKLKILAIHGYRQNSELFRQKTGSFRKIVNKWAEFTYITAPHQVVVSNGEDTLSIGQNEDDQQYGWFFNREDMSFSAIRTGGPAIGFEESVKFVEETFEKEGPFDGIWGFSQGACFVGLLCDLQQRGLLKTKFFFAIMVAGFTSGSVPHLEYFHEPIRLPTLHICGNGDQVIPWKMSKALSKCFEEPIIVEHTGGHFVPGSSKQKEDYQNFFKAQYVRKNLSL